MSETQNEKAMLERIKTAWTNHKNHFRLGHWEGVTIAVDRVVVPPMAWVIEKPEGNVPVKITKIENLSIKRAREDLANIVTDLRDGKLEGKELSPVQVIELLGYRQGESLLDLSLRRFTQTMDDKRISARLPMDKLRASEEKRFDLNGIAEVKTFINEETVTCLRAVEDLTWGDYNFYNETEQKGLMRKQAAQMYPLLAGIMARRFTLKMAIDQMKPLVEAIEKSFTPPLTKENPEPKPLLTKAALSRLRGIGFSTSGVAPEKLGQAISQLPPDWFPKKTEDWKPEDWKAFCDLTATVGTWMKDVTGTPLSMLYEGCAGKWGDLRDRIVRSFADTRPPGGADEDGVKLMTDLIPWKELEKLPREKIPAAAVECAERIKDQLPNGVTQDGVEDWIIRLNAPARDREIISNACLEVAQMSDTFANKVLIPLAANELYRLGTQDIYAGYDSIQTASETSAKVLFSGKSAVKIFELVRTYTGLALAVQSGGTIDPQQAEKDKALMENAELEKKRREIALIEKEKEAIKGAMMVGIDPTSPIPDDGWAPMTPILQAPNGLYIVPLTDPKMLTEEGQGWNGGDRNNPDGSEGNCLCVGTFNGYAHGCRNEGKQIISIRQPTPEGARPYVRLSTCCLYQLKPEDNELRIQEHRGVRNGNVPEEAQIAFNWYKSEIEHGRITLNRDGIMRRVNAARKQISDQIANSCGYEWRERNRIEWAMAPWGSLVDKKWRRMRLEEFSSQPEIIAVGASFDPSFPRRRNEAKELIPMALK